MKSPKILNVQTCTDDPCQRLQAICIPSLKSLRKPTELLSQYLLILFSVSPIPEYLKEVIKTKLHQDHFCPIYCSPQA
eukprot:9734557-Ditylum_brightwellii.AAC.1